MALLELAHVSKRHGRGSRERMALQDVSFEINIGELVAVWGQRRSGRSTLLRVASGIEQPDHGVVYFDGRPNSPPAEGVRDGISYCRKTFRPAEGQLVLDQLVTGQLSRGTPLASARARARNALERTGAGECAALKPNDLDNTEVMRVVIARALTRQPRLLVVDEPTLGVDHSERDEILMLLRSIANEGIAVLMSTDDTRCLTGADRALSLESGELCGELGGLELASVVPLRHTGGLSASA